MLTPTNGVYDTIELAEQKIEALLKYDNSKVYFLVKGYYGS